MEYQRKSVLIYLDEAHTLHEVATDLCYAFGWTVKPEELASRLEQYQQRFSQIGDLLIYDQPGALSATEDILKLAVRYSDAELCRQIRALLYDCDLIKQLGLLSITYSVLTGYFSAQGASIVFILDGNDLPSPARSLNGRGYFATYLYWDADCLPLLDLIHSLRRLQLFEGLTAWLSQANVPLVEAVFTELLWLNTARFFEQANLT